MQGSRQRAVGGRQGLHRVALGARDGGSTGRSTQRAQELEGVRWEQKRWQVGLGTGQSEGHTRRLTTEQLRRGFQPTSRRRTQGPRLWSYDTGAEALAAPASRPLPRGLTLAGPDVE